MQGELVNWIGISSWFGVNWGNVASVFGMVFSLWAVSNARRARQAAEQAAASVLNQSNDQEDNDRLKSLVGKLRSARDASLARGNTDADRIVGRQLQKDTQLVEIAIDALRTELPLSWNENQRNRPTSKARELRTSLEAIRTDQNSRDEWHKVLDILQGLIAEMEQIEREARNQVILPRP